MLPQCPSLFDGVSPPAIHYRWSQGGICYWIMRSVRGSAQTSVSTVMCKLRDQEQPQHAVKVSLTAEELLLGQIQASFIPGYPFQDLSITILGTQASGGPLSRREPSSCSLPFPLLLGTRGVSQLEMLPMAAGTGPAPRQVPAAPAPLTSSATNFLPPRRSLCCLILAFD